MTHFMETQLFFSFFFPNPDIVDATSSCTKWLLKHATCALSCWGGMDVQAPKLCAGVSIYSIPQIYFFVLFTAPSCEGPWKSLKTVGVSLNQTAASLEAQPSPINRVTLVLSSDLSSYPKMLLLFWPLAPMCYIKGYWKGELNLEVS